MFDSEKVFPLTSDVRRPGHAPGRTGFPIPAIPAIPDKAIQELMNDLNDIIDSDTFRQDPSFEEISQNFLI
jgi:hypothetical protein